MGLDITVYKVKKVDQKDAHHVEDFYTLKSCKELIPKFGHLAFKKVNEYYNVTKAIKDLGYKPSQLGCVGMSFGAKAEWSFHDKKHPLYKAYKWLNEIWSETKCKNLVDLQKSKSFKIFESKFKSLLIQNGWVEKYRRYVSGLKKYQFDLVDAWEFCRESIHVSIKNPPTFKRAEKCLALEEVGYQRKGANSQFYEDGMWGSKCITDLNVLKEHWEKYFSKPTPESKGGFGSGVEYDLTAKEMREGFKKNIIDNFVEGETFIIYH